MATLDSLTKKGAVEEESYKHMIPCGEYEIREGNTETHGSDGINGTIVAPQTKVRAAGSGPKEKVRVRVEANGKTVTMERKIHSSGNTLTIPYTKRRELDLEPGDTIEFWIEGVDEGEANENTRVQKTVEEKERVAQQREDYVVIGDSFTYHFLESEDANETVCSISFGDENIRTGSDPGDFLDGCPECKAHSSQSLTEEEVIDFLVEKVSGFDKSEGPPAEFNQEQMNAVKDAVIELEETEADLREYRARVARLEQRIQELEGDGGNGATA